MVEQSFKGPDKKYFSVYHFLVFASWVIQDSKLKYFRELFLWRFALFWGGSYLMQIIMHLLELILLLLRLLPCLR